MVPAWLEVEATFRGGEGSVGGLCALITAESFWHQCYETFFSQVPSTSIDEFVKLIRLIWGGLNSKILIENSLWVKLAGKMI